MALGLLAFYMCPCRLMGRKAFPRKGHKAMESYDQSLSFQGLEPGHGISTTAQARIIPSVCFPEFQKYYDCCLSPSLSLPWFLLWLLFVSRCGCFFHSQHCILKWSICFIYIKKATHRGLQITHRTWFWARNSDQEVVWLAPLRNKEYSMCWRKDKMIICWEEHWVVADIHQSYFFFLGLLEVYILKPLFQLG